MQISSKFDPILKKKNGPRVVVWLQFSSQVLLVYQRVDGHWGHISS